MSHVPSICWVCGKKLGPVVGPVGKSTCVVVQDPIGGEHRVHYICEKDADGKRVRTEPVLSATTKEV